MFTYFVPKNNPLEDSRMKVGSVTDIITEGLEDDLIPPDSDSDDLWEEAM